MYGEPGWFDTGPNGDRNSARDLSLTEYQQIMKKVYLDGKARWRNWTTAV